MQHRSLRSLCPRSLWSHGLFKWCRFAPNKKHKDILSQNSSNITMIFLYKFLLISISYMVLLHSARTADATLASAPPRLSARRRFAVRSAHSCSHTRFARTLARTPCGGHAVYVVSLRSKSARFLWSHAGTLARLTPGSLSPTLPLVARALKRVASLRFKTHKDLSYHSY